MPCSRDNRISSWLDGPDGTGSASARTASDDSFRTCQYPVTHISGKAMISTFCAAASATKRLTVSRLRALSFAECWNWTVATLTSRILLVVGGGRNDAGGGWRNGGVAGWRS